MATYKAPEVTMTLVAFEARLVEAGWTKKDGEYSHPKFADKRISFLPRPFAQQLFDDDDEFGTMNYTGTCIWEYFTFTPICYRVRKLFDNVGATTFTVETPILDSMRLFNPKEWFEYVPRDEWVEVCLCPSSVLSTPRFTAVKSVTLSPFIAMTVGTQTATNACVRWPLPRLLLSVMSTWQSLLGDKQRWHLGLLFLTLVRGRSSSLRGNPYNGLTRHLLRVFVAVLKVALCVTVAVSARVVPAERQAGSFLRGDY